MVDDLRASLSRLLDQSVSFSVLPDYFVDRFVKIGSIDDFLEAIKRKSREGGGGSLRGVPQFEVKGGNAVNLAYALGKFGAKVHLLTIAQSLAAEALRSTFRNMRNVTLDLVDGKNGYTLALEFLDGDRRVNVMVSETGALQNFDGRSITQDSYEKISNGSIVAVVNWGANNKGTELCERVFTIAKKKKNRTFFDPADVSQLAGNIPSLRKQILDPCLLDCMSLNDNELRIFLKTLSNYELPRDYSDAELVRGVKLVSEISNSMVDIHTRKISLTCIGGEVDSVPCHRVEQKIVTGAGDVWDAGDILGLALGWTAEQRLRFANAAAGLYVSKEEAESPTTEEVLSFILTENEYYH